MNIQESNRRKTITIVSIILAGEAVFFLPFVLARIFRPTLLDVFQISNVELGSYFAVYGIVAMISYPLGGLLADRFSARNLMAFALWLTSLGGFTMMFIPSGLVMKFIYGFYAITSILLFWAAMIRATREWGGDGLQGRAFGWLEGGRGATAALLGTIAFIVFALNTSEDTVTIATDSSFNPFQLVIMVVSVIIVMAGVMIWIFVPNNSKIVKAESPSIVLKNIISLIKLPTVWLLSIIIVCAYVGYKITDDFSLYAKEVLGFSEQEAAGVGTLALWLRASIAIIAGYLGDKLQSIKVILYSFAISILGGLCIFTGWLNELTGFAILNLAITAAGIYGIRSLYFAILKEARIPLALTGTAVGIVSIIGYTPDVFMSPWMGYLLDSNPGVVGHQNVFLVLAGFSILGFLTALVFKKISYHNKV